MRSVKLYVHCIYLAIIIDYLVVFINSLCIKELYLHNKNICNYFICAHMVNNNVYIYALFLWYPSLFIIELN